MPCKDFPCHYDQTETRSSLINWTKLYLQIARVWEIVLLILVLRSWKSARFEILNLRVTWHISVLSPRLIPSYESFFLFYPSAFFHRMESSARGASHFLPTAAKFTSLPTAFNQSRGSLNVLSDQRIRKLGSERLKLKPSTIFFEGNRLDALLRLELQLFRATTTPAWIECRTTKHFPWVWSTEQLETKQWKHLRHTHQSQLWLPV